MSSACLYTNTCKLETVMKRLLVVSTGDTGTTSMPFLKTCNICFIQKRKVGQWLEQLVTCWHRYCSSSKRKVRQSNTVEDVTRAQSSLCYHPISFWILHFWKTLSFQCWSIPSYESMVTMRGELDDFIYNADCSSNRMLDISLVCLSSSRGSNQTRMLVLSIYVMDRESCTVHYCVCVYQWQ